MATEALAPLAHHDDDGPPIIGGKQTLITVGDTIGNIPVGIYPNPMGVCPRFPSPLVWAVFAVTTSFGVSTVFWYLGLIPTSRRCATAPRRGSSGSSTASSPSAGAARPCTGGATRRCT